MYHEQRTKNRNILFLLPKNWIQCFFKIATAHNNKKMLLINQMQVLKMYQKPISMDTKYKYIIKAKKM